jgi:diamine N-acetyltransferase
MACVPPDVRYAFSELNLRRIYLRVFAENEGAILLYRRLGFEQEGCLRQHVYKNGRYRDVLVMALLRSDPAYGP